MLTSQTNVDLLCLFFSIDSNIFFGQPIDITIRIQYQTQKTVCDLITKFTWKLKDAAVKIS